MEQLNITAKTLLEPGFSPSPAIPLIIGTVGSFYQSGELAEGIIHLKALLAAPGEFLNDPVWKQCADALMPKVDETISLKSASPYNVYGSAQIKAGALRQMEHLQPIKISMQ